MGLAKTATIKRLEFWAQFHFTNQVNFRITREVVRVGLGDKGLGGNDKKIATTHIVCEMELI